MKRKIIVMPASQAISRLSIKLRVNQQKLFITRKLKLAILKQYYLFLNAENHFMRTSKAMKKILNLELRK